MQQVPLRSHATAITTALEAHVRTRLLLCSLAGFVLVGLVPLLLLLPRRRALHGDARFATHREVARAGLLGHQGIILGEWRGRCLMLAGQQGVCLAAPPRAGKGAGVVIPNLLNWPDSVICVDIKRENWIKTAGFRAASGQACYLFDPVLGRRSHRALEPLPLRRRESRATPQ